MLTKRRLASQGRVATHPDKTKIERELLQEKEGLAKIAKRYGISIPALDRYKKMVLLPRLEARTEIEEEENVGRAKGFLHDILKETVGGIREARVEKEFGGMASLVSAAGKHVEMLAKMNKELVEGPIGNQAAPTVINVIGIPKAPGVYSHLERGEDVTVTGVGVGVGHEMLRLGKEK